MSHTVAVLRADLKRVRRDSFLLFMLAYPWLLALALRWLLPWLDERLAGQVQLSDYYPIAACLLAVMIPYVMGIVLGFQLLEEKDANCLSAVAVTPVSLERYVARRSVIYMLAGVALLIVLHQLVGLVHISWVAIVLVGLGASPSTPLMALIIAGFARNQVEGFAVMKASGFALMIPLASFFIARPWDLIVGVLPTYWPVKAYFLAAEGGGLLGIVLAALVGFVYQALWILILYRRFRRRLVIG